MERKLSFSDLPSENKSEGKEKEVRDEFLKDFIKPRPSFVETASNSLVLFYDQSEQEMPGIRRGTQLGPKKFRDHLLGSWFSIPPNFKESQLTIFDTEDLEGKHEKNFKGFLNPKNNQTFFQVGGDQTQIRQFLFETKEEKSSSFIEDKPFRMIHITPSVLVLLTMEQLVGASHCAHGIFNYNLTPNQKERLDSREVQWHFWENEEAFYKELRDCLESEKQPVFIHFSGSIIHGSLFPGTSHPCALGGVAKCQELAELFRFFGQCERVKGVFLSDYNPTVDSHRSGNLLNILFFSFVAGLTMRKL